MEKVKGKRKENVKEIKLSDALMLRAAVSNLLSTSPTMKGDVVLKLNRAAGKLNFAPKRVQKGELEILKKHINLEKNGDFKTVPLTKEELKLQEEGKIPAESKGTYDYKKEGGFKEAEKEMTAMMDSLVEVELRPIFESDFEKLDIQISRNPNIDLIIEHMVVEGMKIT